ncbi:2-acylglycerol O-acyltransferase 2-A [Brienomyrus brachyistius]|uniref:2-acylglycerol O-acyltransferase 2-A n=1 Tax=Brienomyrus brachyistius TaxID=42636 RepID=UPI0020B426B6|nr:2-acylglycerol O-acyltransferase 2-A [Brienomyrus brachyistius]
MKIEFAPLNIPLRRRLQTAAVVQWVFSFLALAQCCLALFLLLCLSQWWVLAVLYAGWLYLDRDTPIRGGRRSHWVRGWTVWAYFKDYFPISLIKTVDLDPKRNYLFGFHPHGVLVAGGFGNFCTEASGFATLFPGLTPYLLMLPFWFRVPFFRDYIMSGGLVSSEKSSASYILSQPEGGHVAVVTIGGAPESLEARPGALKLQVLNRKGFIKLALKHGAQLVPVFSFGENELFDQMENPVGSPLRGIQDRLQKVMGVALPLFHARGIFQYSFGLLPYRKPIHTVVGRPIQVVQNPCPSREDIDALHKTYLDGLIQLFEENKANYGISEDKHLTFI